MTPDPSAWSKVLETQGPLGLALIVLVAIIAAAVALITVLIRSILKDQRIPTSVWEEECKAHNAITSGLTALTEAVKETTFTLRLLYKGGGS
jgi:hypothetical protein